MLRRRFGRLPKLMPKGNPEVANAGPDFGQIRTEYCCFVYAVLTGRYPLWPRYVREYISFDRDPLEGRGYLLAAIGRLLSIKTGHVVAMHDPRQDVDRSGK